MFNVPVLKLLLPLICASFLFNSCTPQIHKEKVRKVDPYEGITYNVNIKYFVGKEAKQKVSPLVYETLTSKEKEEKYVLAPSFRRHHTLAEMKNGHCDNTVKRVSKDGKVTFYCGGHTSSQR